MIAKNKESEFSASDDNIHIHVNTIICNGVAGIGFPFPLRGSGALSAACLVLIAAGCSAGAGMAYADSILQQVGVTQLQQLVPGLTGGGMAVAQVEAPNAVGGVACPDPALLGQPSSKFTFIGADGSVSTVYSSSTYSGHAEMVASFFYGNGGQGVAPGVSAVDCYDVLYFQPSIIAAGTPPLMNVSGIPSPQSPAVVNQSFVYEGISESADQTYTSEWDSYAAKYNTLFVSAIGDGAELSWSYSSVNPPSDMYNGIAVAAFGGATGIGPTGDGRSKPDITAPGTYTSFSTPIVSGVATLMEQAGRGTDLPGPVGLNSSDAAIIAQGATAYTAAATDIRTVKALLLNGAVKPVGWTNSYSVNNGTYTYNAVSTKAITPLDPRYGSGVVNAYNSYENLAGGEHNYSSATSQSIAALPSVTSSPTANFSGSVSEAASATNPATVTGWNLATIAATSTSNAVENYDFNLTGTSVNSWDLTATLTWNKDYNASGINHLMLFLLNSSGQQVASSTSMLDNVQQININPALGINSLAPGQYDLAVEMLGGVNAISTSDTYALAWNFVDPTTVPEPAALATFAIGLAMFMLPRKRKVVTALGSIKQ